MKCGSEISKSVSYRDYLRKNLIILKHTNNNHMNRYNIYFTIFLSITMIVAFGFIKSDTESADDQSNEWISIWDGETLNNWRASENPDSFEVVDGKIVVDGPRGHLFYEGPIANANFVNFEFRADVYTYPEANSGVFFHTQYQEEGWPQYGYEAQVNATHRDPRKTGSLYAVKDVMDVAPHEDHEWFHYYIKVDGRDITFKVDGETVMEFTEPEDREGTIKLSSGTIALQAHDPNSRIYFKNIEVRVLD